VHLRRPSKKSNFKGILLGVVNLAVLACVLRTTTKKVVNFFLGKVHPRENPGYAYVTLGRNHI